MSTIIVVPNLSGLDATSMAAKGQDVHDKMNANLNFPTAQPYMAALQGFVNALTTCITTAGSEPSKAQTAAIKDAVSDVKRTLRFICAIANWDCYNNETKLLTSGFDIKAPKASSPKSFVAKLGKLSTTIDLSINSYGSGVAYQWFGCPDPIIPANWVQVALTTTSKVTITGQTPGVKMWYLVKMFKGDKLIATSDPYTIMVV